ncbi:cytochrome c oxidase subunit II [Brevibacillus sp. SYSU BS000544]|uniref:cytochrome c oxidase subunit II n=1 Tax=Brevibacillus sp. SYSU BS000544 TaxID=3416443 RepID=UPI003CE4C25C
MNIQRQHLYRLLPVFLGLVLLTTGCGDPYLSTLEPSGPVASEQLFLMKLALYIMIGVFLVVITIFFYVIIRFRKREGQTELPVQVEGNHKLEIIWTVIPLILLLIIAVPTVSSTFKLAKNHSNDQNAVLVKVTGHQFWWEFEYPKLGVVTAQELYIPVGKKIQFELTSADVIHSFWVPALGGKTDNNPGMTNTMWLQADKPGTYKGKCAELCGTSHALMDFKVIAVSPEEFDKWVNKMKKPAVTELSAQAKQGEQVFQKSCIGCHAIGGQGGKVGPNLTNFGDRELVVGIKTNNKEELEKWIRNPQEVKPGNKMPQVQLTPEQLSSVVEYLGSLKSKE